MPLQVSFGDGLSCNCLNLRILGIPNDAKHKWVSVPGDLIRIKLFSLSQIHQVQGKSIIACKGCHISLFVVNGLVHDLKCYLEENERNNVDIYIYEVAQYLSTLKDLKTVSQFGIRMDMLSTVQNVGMEDRIQSNKSQMDPEIDDYFKYLVSERKKENRQALLSFLRSQQDSYEKYTKDLEREASCLSRNSLHTAKIHYEGEMKAFSPSSKGKQPKGVKPETKHPLHFRKKKPKKQVAFTDRFEVISADGKQPSKVDGQDHKQVNTLAHQNEKMSPEKDNDNFRADNVEQVGFNTNEELAFDISFSDLNENEILDSLPSGGTSEVDVLTSNSYSKDTDFSMDLDSSFSESLPMTIQSSSYTEHTPSSSLSSDSSFEAPTASFIDRKERWLRMLQKADEHSRSVHARSMGYNLNDEPNLITSYKHSFLSHGWKSLN
ncbi:tor Complex Tor2 interacting protein 1 [Schizosaccharomyces octosporus yFS286]|uniref:Tor Complex Tor2 interacting protein 1 n=1 Tax=Schizosaccharomyces octosporus (strain yFS286) TaxID=483514 RepID=S9RET3_SCHOY|nr:tor Complex Tor2 interacting protein 1 [Schizosaccharomyces octosporus yFS286]EPX72569.1 tor Complex Tor2 interacting protein 1 [Schizosaccharomyces octosporus yFS286]